MTFAPNALGELPLGMHTATLEEVEAVFVTTPRRRRLFEGLACAQNLHAAGVRRAFINGSFVTTKADPNDIDGCWEWTEEVHLDLLDSVLLHLAQGATGDAAKYGVDFLLATWVEAAQGSPSSTSSNGNRADDPKGIVQLDLEEMS